MSPAAEQVVKVVIIYILLVILRRIKLAELKHVATITALNDSLKNGFKDTYEKTLRRLKDDYRFIMGRLW